MSENLLTIYDGWEHFFGHLGKLVIRLLVVRLLDLRDLPIGVNDKDFAKRYTNVHITHGIRLSIAKPTVKWWLLWRE